MIKNVLIIILIKGESRFFKIFFFDLLSKNRFRKIPSSNLGSSNNNYYYNDNIREREDFIFPNINKNFEKKSNQHIKHCGNFKFLNSQSKRKKCISIFYLKSSLNLN